jgi:sulfur-oxidizing protein SoxX
MINKTRYMWGALAAAAVVAGCASSGAPQDLDAEFAAMMKSSFRDQGIAKTDRLQQDLGQASSGLPAASTSATGRQAKRWPRAAGA